MSPEERLEVAEQRLARWRRRAIVRVRHAQGVSVDGIAEEAGCSSATVRRDIYYVRRVAGNPPVTPSLLIDRRALGEIDTPTLMAALAAWPYTASIYAPEWLEGVVPGSWAEIRQARFDGGLTHAEYDSLLPFKPDESRGVTARIAAEPDSERLVAVVDSLHHHIAVRESEDLAEAPDSCSCGRWDRDGSTFWEEHIALDVLMRLDLAATEPDRGLARVRAALRVLGDDDITPTGRRQLVAVLDAIARQKGDRSQ